MKKLTAAFICAVALILLSTTLSASAFKPIYEVMYQYTQVTSDPHYDRDSSFFQAADHTYWLFFARGRDARGVRGVDGYEPDSDFYDVYYKTSPTISGLANASEILIPLTPPDNAQKDIAALQTSDGTIWVFVSTGLGEGTERSIYYYTYDGTWHGPTAVPGTDYAAHISALEYDGKLWVFFDLGYTLYCTAYDEDAEEWSTNVLVANNATIAKASVIDNEFYVVWSFVNEIENIWGSGIYLSSSTDGTTWQTTADPIAQYPLDGATNWDPVLTKENEFFKLIWAPDIGTYGQILAITKSTTPKDASSWSSPVSLTSSSFGEKNWWDFWPQVFTNGLEYVFFTSERNSSATDRIDGNIWIMDKVVNYYLPLVFR